MKVKRETIRNDKRYYIEKILGNIIWDRQADVVDSIIKNTRTSVKSCHASGKSFIAARIVLKFLHSYAHSIALTTAPTFRQVTDILWTEINTAFDKALVKLPGNMLNVRYDLDSDWFGLGLSTDEPEKFQGYHSDHILVVADEASGVTKKIFDAIEGITSTGFVRILLIGNPTDPTGYFADTFKSQIWSKQTISCVDTPNFENIKNIEQLKNSTEQQRLDSIVMPYLITPQWVFERLQEWGEDSPLFQARVLGEFPTKSDDTLIALKYVEQAILNEKSEGEDWQIGLDVARFGSDKTCFIGRKGNKIEFIDWFQKEDTMQTTGRAMDYLRKYSDAKICVDEIGVGAGVIDRLKESEFSNRCIGINVAEKVQDDENTKYVNLRAKGYWKLRERFLAGDINLIDKGTIISDLTNMKYKFRSSDGALKIESKEDIKKRGLRSPDLADALMLAFLEEVEMIPEIHFI